MAAQRLSRRTTLSLRTHLLLLIEGRRCRRWWWRPFVFRVIADNRAAVEQAPQAARASATLVDAELQGSIRALQALAESDPLTNDDVPRFYAEATRLIPESAHLVGRHAVEGPDGSRIAYRSAAGREALWPPSGRASIEQLPPRCR